MDFETWKQLGEEAIDPNKVKAWRDAGKVRRRWFAFGAGVIVGVAAVLLLSAFGCSESPRAVQTGPNSACFPGPKVVAE